MGASSLRADRVTDAPHGAPDGSPPFGSVPTSASIYLICPKFPANLGMVARLAACFGIARVWYSGDRMQRALSGMERLPRELRMRDYPKPRHVANVVRAIGTERHPVAVELVDGAVDLPLFDHSAASAYIFGPEDGSLTSEMLRVCHSFVRIPARHCLSLPTAVTAVLYDRAAKATGQ